LNKNEIILTIVLLLSLTFSCNSDKSSNSDEETNLADSIVENNNLTEFDSSEMVEESEFIFDTREREKWQNPTLVLQKLGDIENKKIADIGSGTGYFTFPLALRADKVIAIDIEPKFLDYIEDQKADYSPKIANTIETRLTTEDEPSLQKNEVDIAFMVNVYSYLQNRVEYLQKIKTGLARNGILLIVDFKKGNLDIGPSDDLKIASSQVVDELKQAGFKIVEEDTKSLQYQYIIKAK